MTDLTRVRSPRPTLLSCRNIPAASSRSLKPRLASNAEKYVKSAPLNTVAPTISPTGSQVSGTVLTTTNGTWLFSPSITYKWLRNGNVIPGATTVTYTTVTADKTFQIQSQVNASNSNGASAEPSSNSVSVT